MSSLLGIRVDALLLAWVAASAALAASPTPPDPRRFVASIYDKGHEGDVWAQWLDGKQRVRWFSRGAAALWAKAEARAKKEADQLGAFDFDLATNSQGMEVKSFRVEALSTDADRAVVTAKLVPDNWVRKSTRENVVRYDLVREQGRWTIDDIHGVVEPNEWSFRQILTRYLR